QLRRTAGTRCAHPPDESGDGGGGCRGRKNYRRKRADLRKSMSEVVVSAANGACRIELNRPDCGNLVTTGMVGELARALQSVAADVKLVVITGRGADFCKGRDYQSAPESAVADKGAPSALDIRERMTGPMMTL